MGWTIKQAAEKIGISADTLRYYDKKGIVSPKRRENGYRYYDDADIATLKNIIVMKYAHFSLTEMKAVEEMFTRMPSANCNEITRDMLNTKIAELKQVVRNYQKIVTLMEELLSMIDGTDSYLANEDRIDEFINQIYEGIRNDHPFSFAALSLSDRNEVE